jgi:ribosome-associated translation inhibitor RaiA
MQVLLNTDPHIDGRHHMVDHLKTVVDAALGRFGEQITRVEAHLADVSNHVGAKAQEISCTLEARLVGLEPVVVKERAASAHQAMQGAVDKLRRAVDSVLAKHVPRHLAPGSQPID